MQFRLQIANTGLRMASMGAKLLLALYMGRFFGLTEIGTYGLVFGAVSVLGVIMGQDLIYVVSRTIVGEDEATALCMMRDQVVHYGLNYVLLAFITVILILTHATEISPHILIYTLILAVLESLATVTYYNLNAMNNQIAANALFFIRSGLWVFPVILLCVISPGLRNADTIFVAWTIGAAGSLVATLWFWRGYPWRTVMKQPVDWAWIKKAIAKGTPVWLGMMGLTAGTYVDRFVVENVLTMEDVGILTFYFSFTNALLTLLQSGVSVFATPRMIRHHRDGNQWGFDHEAQQAVLQVALGGGIAATAFGITVPLISYLLGRPSLVAYIGTFWILLCATWIRASAETFANILFARHQDRAVWLGNLLFLVPALGGNLVFIPFFGFKGIGFSAMVASAFIFLWRWKHVRSYITP